MISSTVYTIHPFRLRGGIPPCHRLLLKVKNFARPSNIFDPMTCRPENTSIRSATQPTVQRLFVFENAVVFKLCTILNVSRKHHYSLKVSIRIYCPLVWVIFSSVRLDDESIGDSTIRIYSDELALYIKHDDLSEHKQYFNWWLCIIRARNQSLHMRCSKRLK